MIAPEDYCREIEAYLCRKNDGHLIRIVGPAFEQVAGWARDGIPLKVACAGVDRYFERYYRKGPRRRPVRIEFCDADVRDAFDDWRRAVGVAQVEAAGAEEGSPQRRRSALAAHVERALHRLTLLRGSTRPSAALTEALDEAVRRLDALLPAARRVRGDDRRVLTAQLQAIDRDLLQAALAALTAGEQERLAAESARELDPFRGRMLPEALTNAQATAFERALRDHWGLPALRYE